MPEPERLPPTLATSGQPDRSAGSTPSASQAEADRPGSGFPETVPDCACPPAGPAAGTPPVAQVGRYPILGELGRGGMGAVLLSRDPELGRDLALKVLREDGAGRPEVVQRFREEAQVGGQLQHPSVVPVYELGCSADGRPYFTMKLVKGATLSRLLKERADPARERPRFLKVFEQVCQAVGYAHSKGVIHRDLKPSNVMVGAFGEVQVMDWGLAKVLKPAADAVPEPVAEQPVGTTVSAQVLVSRADSETPSTQEGDVLGTPAYMPPEQALGEISRLDQRSDVFSLGAILCELLTGAPPYVAANRVAVLRQARRAELDEAQRRLAACGGDEELIGLARRCLAAKPADRPRDAGTVARAVEAYLASVEERARQAELERAKAEARGAEERKRRRVQLALGGALLLLVVGGGAGAWKVQQQRQAHQAEAARRRQDALATVNVQLDEARNFRKQARAHPLGDPARFLQAREAADQALKLIDASEAAEELRPQAETLVEELRDEVVAAERDRVLLAALLEVRGPRDGPMYRTDDRGLAVAVVEPDADEQFQAAFKEWGLKVDATPTAMAAARLKRRPAAVVAEMVAALDEWASERRRLGQARADWERLAALAAALDDGPGVRRRRELRGLLAAGRLPFEQALRTISVLLRPVPMPFDAGPGRDRQRLRQLATDVNPGTEPVLGLLTLTRALWVAGDAPVAERLLRAAVRARPQEVVLHATLGTLLERQRPPRWRQALECYTAVRALRPELGEVLAWALVQVGRAEDGLALYELLRKERPGNPGLHARHGHALGLLKKYAEAEAACRRAIACQPDYPWAYNTLGVVLRAQKKPVEAEAACRRAIKLKPDFFEAYTNLGNALFDQKELSKADDAFRKALALKPNLAAAYNSRGAVLSAQNNPVEAEAAFRRAIALQPDDANAYTNLGNLLRDQKKLGAAEAAHRRAIQLQPDFAGAYYNLGNVLLDQKRPVEAEVACRSAIALQPDFADAYTNLGNALHNQKKPVEAEAAYRRAIALQPDLVRAYNNLGNVLREQKKPVEAEAAYRRAIALQPNYAEAYNSLGAALYNQKKPLEAEAAFRKAIALQPDLYEAYYNLGKLLSIQHRLAEAEAAFRKVSTLKPDFSTAYFDLGNVLHAQKRPVEAEAAFRKAIALKPDSPRTYFNLGNVLLDQKRPAEAEAAFRKAIALKPDEAPAHNNLGNALAEQKKLVEAEAAFRRAIALQPDLAWAHSGLGHVLREQGQFTAALASLRRADALGSKIPGWPYPTPAWVRHCERLVELDRRLPAVLGGDARPASAAEGLEFATLCQRYRGRHAAAVRFYADAFAADPKLAADLRRQHRYNAACSAARAAAGQGEDATRLPERVILALRRQALRWLRADLEALTVLIAREPRAKQALPRLLEHWQQDTDLASVREKEMLSRLPEYERAAWRQLWADVAALRRR